MNINGNPEQKEFYDFNKIWILYNVFKREIKTLKIARIRNMTMKYERIICIDSEWEN